MMNAGGPVGPLLAPLFGGPMVDHWGIRSLFLVELALLPLVIVVLSLGSRDSFQGSNKDPMLQLAAETARLIWDALGLRAIFATLFILFAGWIMAITIVPPAITAL